MAKFSYQIKTTTGEIREGQIEASSQEAAAQALTRDRNDIFITHLSSDETKSITNIQIFAPRIKLQDKLFFTQQLAIMIKSGLSITAALSSMKDQAENKAMEKILEDILNDVKGGQPLSSALGKHPELLPDIYVKIIASGEKSGKLDKVLIKLTKDLEKSVDLRGKIRGAMIYPIFLLVVIVGVVAIVLTTIVPQLKKMFEDAGATLPITTKILIGLSNFTIKFWWLLILAAILIVVGIWQYGKTESGKLVLDTIKLKIPIFGLLNKKIYIARFTRTLNTLLSAGMPILEIFEILSTTIGNVIYENEIAKARKKIESGFTVSAALAESKQFPPVLSDLIAVGEKSGNMTYVLDNLTRFYEREVDDMTKNLATMLEPVMMIIMGLGVGFLVASVIMPIYGLVQVIK